MPKQKRHSTGFANVYYIECMTNGKKDKSYFVTFRDEYGKKKQKTIGRHSQGYRPNSIFVEQQKITQKIKNGEELMIGKRRKILTFYEAFHQYIEFAKNEKKTWKKDKELFENHLSELHGKELTKLTQKNFNDIKAIKQKDYSESTVLKILGVARQVINYAINNDLVKNYTNPISKGRVHMKQPNNKKLAFLQKEDASLMLKEFKENRSNRLYHLTVLALFTGARFSEIASLTWNDLNFINNQIYFKPTKKGNDRYIEMEPIVKEILLSLKGNKSYLVFPDDNGNEMHQISKQWQKTFDSIFPHNINTAKKDTDEYKKKQQYRMTYHGLRHTYASWLAMSGEYSLLEIKEKLGHKTTQMTERYAHLIPKANPHKHSKAFEGL